MSAPLSLLPNSEGCFMPNWYLIWCLFMKHAMVFISLISLVWFLVRPVLGGEVEGRRKGKTASTRQRTEHESCSQKPGFESWLMFSWLTTVGKFLSLLWTSVSISRNRHRIILPYRLWWGVNEIAYVVCKTWSLAQFSTSLLLPLPPTLFPLLCAIRKQQQTELHGSPRRVWMITVGWSNRKVPWGGRAWPELCRWRGGGWAECRDD